MSNQAAGLSWCLTKVLDTLVKQLKVIQTDKSKGKSASKTQEATDELDYVMTFNRSITQAMTESDLDLSYDSYMDKLKASITQDTLTALRNTLHHMSSLFPDHLLAKAE